MVILKLVFEKASDKINHEVTMDILKHKGFGQRWMRWMDMIMNYGTSVLSTKNDYADGSTLRSNGLRSGLSAIATRIVHACTESVRVHDLLAKPAVLTREPTYNGSRPPSLYR